MKKKKFRILVTKKGFITYYTPQVKTWCGWRSFFAFINTGNIIMVGSNSSNNKLDSYREIDAYCNLKGIFESNREIT